MLELFIDAISQGNPGPSGDGIDIKEQGKIEEHAFFPGGMNNHEAEFNILYKALELCRKKDHSAVWLKTDSKIVCDFVEKRYVKNEKFQPYLEKCLAIVDIFALFFIKWIPEREYQHADRLACQAVHKNSK